MIPKTHTLRLIVAGALLIVGPAGLPAEADGPSSANSTAQKAASSVAAVSPAGPTAAARGATAPSAAPKSGAEPLITNIFSDTDLRQALMDIAAQAGIPIIPDATVQGTVSVDLKNAPLERALSMVLLGGGYAFAKQDGYYLVGSPEPDNPNFHLLTRTEIVDLKYVMPQTVIALLGCYRRYLSAESAPQQSPAPPPRTTAGGSVGPGRHGGGAPPPPMAETHHDALPLNRSYRRDFLSRR